MLSCSTPAGPQNRSKIRAPRRATQKKQRACYSGKKKRHTLKTQLVVDKATGMVLSVAAGKGREHDFRLFKRSGRQAHDDTDMLADSGYQGLARIHPKCRTPHKRKRKTLALSEEQRTHNRALASERVCVEHVIRRLKVFRRLKETYRHRRRRHGLRVHLLAGLHNHDLTTK